MSELLLHFAAGVTIDAINCNLDADEEKLLLLPG